MESQNPNVYIIGAGISGLIAALVLEENGIHPTIIEATERPGGRVKTDIIEGFQLDRGFQVLLSNYPAAQKYLDYDALQLQKFKAGACIFIDGKQKFFGDPLRDLSMVFSTLFSGIGNLSDKLKVLKLNKKLQKKSLPAIFETKETTTLQYLQDLGFSTGIINQFFKPFFSGIFLETALDTSSRMFEFVFKMFGEGLALLPKGGIEEISKQLTNKLQHTTFRLNTKVATVNNQVISLENGEEIEADYTIIATEPSSLVSNLSNQKTAWKSCQNLYFTTSKKSYEAPFIGLVTKENSLINNIFYHTSLPMVHQGEGELLSVTVVKEHQLTETALIEAVQKELKENCNIQDTTFLKLYHIPKALPQLQNIQYELQPSETRLTDTIFLAGDIQLNGSLNAAMIAGERAATAILSRVEQAQKQL